MACRTLREKRVTVNEPCLRPVCVHTTRVEWVRLPRYHCHSWYLTRTTHLIQRAYYQRGSPCQDSAGNRTTRRSNDHRKKTQTEEVWTCLPFIRSDQDHLVRQVKGGRRRRQKRMHDDNIREWSGLGFSKSPTAVENREKWRKLVAKPSVVPQRPSQLRNRWRWRWRKIFNAQSIAKVISG